MASSGSGPTYVIGVDVGGTNTDCAVLELPSCTVAGKCKATTSADVTSGIKAAITGALASGSLSAADVNVEFVSIGTTHFVNAVVERDAEKLSKVVILRCCGPSSRALPPATAFPDELREVVYHSHAFLSGGFEFDGDVVSPFEEEAMKAEITAALDGVPNEIPIVVSGTFSAVNPAQELAVAAWIAELFPERTDVVCSHTVAGIGLIERENAAVLNAAIRPMAKDTIQSFFDAQREVGLDTTLYITQNDGTLISWEEAARNPVLTFASGPTNSMRGAAFLTKLENCIVADIGGTTTDCGALVKGFPRPCAEDASVGGVRINFRMPDLFVVGLGGGSIVTLSEDGSVAIGPESVGYRLKEASKTFGGTTLTTTDVVVASRGIGALADSGEGEATPVAITVDAVGGEAVVAAAQEEIRRMLDNAVDQMMTSADPIPVVCVGGGSILAQSLDSVAGCPLLFPEHFEVANAIGAAIGQVSGSYDKVHQVPDDKRDEVVAAAKEAAIASAVARGAVPETVKVADFQETPLAYLPGDNVRIQVRTVGDLAVFQGAGHRANAKSKTTYTGLPGGDNVPSTINAGDDGVWTLTEEDIDLLAIGCGILGTGGGGNTYYGSIRAKQCIRSGTPIRVVSPSVAVKAADKVFPVAYMGAPTILQEKGVSGTELAGAVAAIDGLSVFASTEGESDRYLMSGEIGGLNGIEPLVSAALAGEAVVDCDLMGRAFPKLDMAISLINGLFPIPCALSSDASNTVVLTSVTSASFVEEIFREATNVMGGAAGLCLPPLRGEQLAGNTIPYTVTKAWLIGKAVAEARAAKEDPVAAAVAANEGVVLFRGKITDVLRSLEGSFNFGVITIQGLTDDAEFAGQTATVDIQNENLVCRRGDGTVLACTPDLISVLHTDSAENIFTEDVRYGLRVSVVAMPCHPLMRSEKALAVTGPGNFHYDEITYVAAADA